MKININQIPPEGLGIEEQVKAQALDLETDIIKFRTPLNIKAQISCITNAVIAKLSVDALGYTSCSRCLSECEMNLKKDFQLEYILDKGDVEINFDPDIRQEIIIDYPIKPLCRPTCKGLCLHCGKNLNEGKCNCKSALVG